MPLALQLTVGLQLGAPQSSLARSARARPAGAHIARLVPLHHTLASQLLVHRIATSQLLVHRTAASQPLLHRAAASRCCIHTAALAYPSFADRSSSLRTSRVCAIACLYHMLAPQLLAAQPRLAHTAAALTPRSACAETRRRTDGDRAAGIGARRNETLGEHANGEVEGQCETGRVRRRQMHQRRMPCVSHRVREGIADMETFMRTRRLCIARMPIQTPPGG